MVSTMAESVADSIIFYLYLPTESETLIFSSPSFFKKKKTPPVRLIINRLLAVLGALSLGFKS